METRIIWSSSVTGPPRIAVNAIAVETVELASSADYREDYAVFVLARHVISRRPRFPEKVDFLNLNEPFEVVFTASMRAKRDIRSSTCIDFLFSRAWLRPKSQELKGRDCQVW